MSAKERVRNKLSAAALSKRLDSIEYAISDMAHNMKAIKTQVSNSRWADLQVRINGMSERLEATINLLSLPQITELKGQLESTVYLLKTNASRNKGENR